MDLHQYKHAKLKKKKKCKSKAIREQNKTIKIPKTIINAWSLKAFKNHFF